MLLLEAPIHGSLAAPTAEPRPWQLARNLPNKHRARPQAPPTSHSCIFAGTRSNPSEIGRIPFHSYHVIAAATGANPAWPESRPSSDCPLYVQPSHPRGCLDRMAYTLTRHVLGPRDRLSSRHSLRRALPQLPHASRRRNLRSCATTQLALRQSGES